MSLSNPSEFWTVVAAQENWREYVLPDRTDEAFDHEGFLESQRLFYWFDSASTVVDYGCGPGRVLKYVARRAGRAIGVDLTPDFLVKAKSYVDGGAAEFYSPDELRESGIADFVYCLLVLQHNDAPHRNRIVEHIHSLLKVGGVALLQFPRAESTYYKEIPFVHKFTRVEVEGYGNMFSRFQVRTGNLPNYGAPFDRAVDHEYFLIGKNT